jgi:hypothetical protein
MTTAEKLFDDVSHLTDEAGEMLLLLENGPQPHFYRSSHSAQIAIAELQSHGLAGHADGFWSLTENGRVSARLYRRIKDHGHAEISYRTFMSATSNRNTVVNTERSGNSTVTTINLLSGNHILNNLKITLLKVHKLAMRLVLGEVKIPPAWVFVAGAFSMLGVVCLWAVR